MWTIGSVEYAQDRGQSLWGWRGRVEVPVRRELREDDRMLRSRLELTCRRGYRHTVAIQLQVEKDVAWRQGEAQRWVDGLEGRMAGVRVAPLEVPEPAPVHHWNNGDSTSAQDAWQLVAWQRQYLCRRHG